MEKHLSFLDKYLPLWIFLAMAVGVSIGYFKPDAPSTIEANNTTEHTDFLLASGLILMLLPPLTKVRYEKLGNVFKDKKGLSISLTLNWIIGPLLMFFLSVILLSSEPGYMYGLIMIGLARCIAMVLVWNELAKGDTEYATGLVALNCLFQLIFYPAYAFLFIYIFPEWMNLPTIDPIKSISIGIIAKNVGIYLGIPFLIGGSLNLILRKNKGENWFYKKFIPKISPITLIALLFTIVIMFSYKGREIVELPQKVILVSFPLILYFLIMFFVSFWYTRHVNMEYAKSTAISFTATGNNFELAIAVCIATFGIDSDEAFAAVIGPLIEVPTLILLVKYALRKRP